MNPVRVCACADNERGMALVLVLMASTLLFALGGSLALETMTEGMVASNYRDGVVSFHAAEAAAGVAMATLVSADTWAAQPEGFVVGRLDQLLGVAPTTVPVLVTVSLADAGATDRITIIARADGPGRSRRTIRVTVARAADPTDRVSLRIIAWEEVR